MNRLLLSIREFISTVFRRSEGKKRSFCFAGYSSDFSVSAYLQRLSELCDNLRKEREKSRALPLPSLMWGYSGARMRSDGSVEEFVERPVEKAPTHDTFDESNIPASKRLALLLLQAQDTACTQTSTGMGYYGTVESSIQAPKNPGEIQKLAVDSCNASLEIQRLEQQIAMCQGKIRQNELERIGVDPGLAMFCAFMQTNTAISALNSQIASGFNSLNTGCSMFGTRK